MPFVMQNADIVIMLTSLWRVSLTPSGGSIASELTKRLLPRSSVSGSLFMSRRSENGQNFNSEIVELL